MDRTLLVCAYMIPNSDHKKRIEGKLFFISDKDQESTFALFTPARPASLTGMSRHNEVCCLLL